MKITAALGLLFLTIVANAQKTEEGYDYYFKPTKGYPRYYVITEKQDSLWHRKAYYVPEKTLAMEGWYKDEKCKIAVDTLSWYHPNRIPKTRGVYNNGQKVGLWLAYNDKGALIDSGNFINGKLKGVRMKWYDNGYAADSLQFDGQGNGVEVSWYENGVISSAGYWTADTTKKGRWKYFNEKGSVIATEDYIDGKKVSSTCFDDAGHPLPECLDKEAVPEGGMEGWKQFVVKNLDPTVPARKGAPVGMYTVQVRFIVDVNGNITDVHPLTHYGYGMEEEVLRMFKKAPRWTPGYMHGQVVRSYHTQPISFMISNSSY